MYVEFCSSVDWSAPCLSPWNGPNWCWTLVHRWWTGHTNYREPSSLPTLCASSQLYNVRQPPWTRHNQSSYMARHYDALRGGQQWQACSSILVCLGTGNIPHSCSTCWPSVEVIPASVYGISVCEMVWASCKVPHGLEGLSLIPSLLSWREFKRIWFCWSCACHLSSAPHSSICCWQNIRSFTFPFTNRSSRIWWWWRLVLLLCFNVGIVTVSCYFSYSAAKL